MSVTFSYSGTYNHGRLSDELVAGGVTVLTVRGTTSDIEVVCADGTLEATVDAIEAAHSGATPPPHDYPLLTGSTTTFVRGDGSLADPAASHVALGDPHTQYQLESQKDAPSGYAGLDGDQRVTKGTKTTDDVIVNAATKGLVLKDSEATPHYWRVTVSGVGALVVTDIGTSAP